MKKIININLSGRVIPIEDAAYESLQDYIDSLRRYFAQEEGRDEIINDIESRVAELMNDKVKKGAPAITEADMSEIINTMGRVEDFEQEEPHESSSFSAGAKASGAQAAAESAPIADVKPRGRLYRDASDKILGGVSSGIANYFGIDPAIVRILFVLLTFGAGMSILVYILLWIVLPARQLEPTLKKRLFRNPDDRILGGVAGGIGAYFNKDAWTIRLIFLAPLLLNMFFAILNGLFFAWHRDVFPNFVLGSFTGTFILTYIILWIILPIAKSAFDKMEMRGENVDVNRIRQNVKDKAQAFFNEEVKPSATNLGKRAREFAGTRGKSFAAEVGQSARPIASGAGRAIGILFKVILLGFGGLMAFIFFILLVSVLFGGMGEFANNFLLDGFRQKFLAWSSVLLLFGVPLIGLLTWIIRRLMKVRSHNRYLGWTFGGLWLIGIILGGLFAASMVKSWRTYAKVSEAVTLPAAPASIVVAANDPEIETTRSFDFFDPGDDMHVIGDTLRVDEVRVRFEKSKDSQYHVTVWRYSAGRSTVESRQRAQAIGYNTTITDSVLNINSYLSVTDQQKYRGQKVLVTVQVPVGKTVRLDRSLEHRIQVTSREDGNRYYWRREHDLDWDDDSWFDWTSGVNYVMTADGTLVDPAKPKEKSTEGVYEYGEEERADSAARTIDTPQNNIDTNRRNRATQQRNRRTAETEAAAVQQSTAFLATPVFSLLF
jgi:phage shock protein PspC (stress-responsive transcriptional regulator)